MYDSLTTTEKQKITKIIQPEQSFNSSQNKVDWFIINLHYYMYIDCFPCSADDYNGHDLVLTSHGMPQCLMLSILGNQLPYWKSVIEWHINFHNFHNSGHHCAMFHKQCANPGRSSKLIKIHVKQTKHINESKLRNDVIKC